MQRTYWIDTANGGLMDFLTPRIDMIDLRDISIHLSRICRFTGGLRHDSEPYSVAEHLIWCANLASDPAKPYALLHDAHEAYIGDMSSPLKALLRDHSNGIGYAEIANKLDSVIYPAFGLQWPVPTRIKDEVKAIDMMALATERRDLMHPSHRLWEETLPEPHPHSIKPVPWSIAAASFEIEVKLLALSGSLSIPGE